MERPIYLVYDLWRKSNGNNNAVVWLWAINQNKVPKGETRIRNREWNRGGECSAGRGEGR